MQRVESHPRAGQQAGTLLSVNVGLPKDVSWQGRTVFTGVFKDPVPGSRRVRTLNVDGDGQGDRAGHGGEQRAVFVYQMDSYRYWERELGRDDFTYGQFGENFTVEGLSDAEVCIGDRYRIGTAVFEETQPRVTCYRVGIRMNDPRIPALLVSHHRPGFYFRVIEEGDVEAGDDIIKVVSGPEHMTVADVDALLYLPGHTRQGLLRALRIPALSPGWQGSFRALLDEQPGGGNAGLVATSPPPAWPGFRQLTVTAITRESDSAISIWLEDSAGAPVPAARPGQYLTVRVQPNKRRRPVLRNYSLSGPPGAGYYRISVKRERYGAASGYLHHRLAVGDPLDIEGRIRDGHGDLRCEHVYLTDDGPRIIDCVEFDPLLRMGDVLSDIAFLAMDLERLGADELASSLLCDYRELGADAYPESLLDFYVAYRAIVRAKVRAMRSGQSGAVDHEVSRLVEIAHAHLQRAVPVMVCVGGLPGTGKSTLSEAYATSSGAVHISTDEIRHGLHPLGVGGRSLFVGSDGRRVRRAGQARGDRIVGGLLGRTRRVLARRYAARASS
jgi:MOSC domain-containing protein YiiM